MIVNCKICGKDLTIQAILVLDGEIKRIKCDCYDSTFKINEYNEENNNRKRSTQRI